MIKVNVLLADGFEEIEALAVVDLLRRAQIYVGTVSIGEDYQVHGAHGINVQTEDLFEEGVRKAVTDFAESGKVIGAICAAPTVLSDLGLLKGRRIACYPSVESEIQGAVIVKIPVVVDGNIVTSRGAGTAIDFALELITVLAGKQKAASIAESIIYE